MLSKIESQADVSGLIDVFTETWGAETLSEFVSSIQSTECVLAKNDKGEVIGYAFYGIDEREDFLEITDVGVGLACRGAGYGHELVSYICNLHPCVRLTVKESNPAKYLYERNGFKVIQIYQNYYGVRQDGLRMEFKFGE